MLHNAIVLEPLDEMIRISNVRQEILAEVKLPEAL